MGASGAEKIPTSCAANKAPDGYSARGAKHHQLLIQTGIWVLASQKRDVGLESRQIFISQHIYKYKHNLNPPDKVVFTGILNVYSTR